MCTSLPFCHRRLQGQDWYMFPQFSAAWRNPSLNLSVSDSAEGDRILLPVLPNSTALVNEPSSNNDSLLPSLSLLFFSSPTFSLPACLTCLLVCHLHVSVPVWLSVCLCLTVSVCIYLCLTFYLFVCLSVGVSVCLPVCLFACLRCDVSVSDSLSVCLCLLVCRYLCLTVFLLLLFLCLSVCLSVGWPVPGQTEPKLRPLWKKFSSSSCSLSLSLYQKINVFWMKWTTTTKQKPPTTTKAC